jgi:hypothetical protein
VRGLREGGRDRSDVVTVLSESSCAALGQALR